MSYLNNSRSSLTPKTSHTLDKCQKILRMFQQVGRDGEMCGNEDRDNSNVYAKREYNNKNDHYQRGLESSSSKSKVAQNNPYYISQPSAKKYTTNTNKPSVVNKSTSNYQSASRSTTKTNNNFNNFNNSSSSFFINPNNHNQSSSSSKININKNHR